MAPPAKHTRLFGSTSARTLQCPAHYKLGRDIPDPPQSEAAAEGAMIHGVCEDILKQDMRIEDHPKWDELDEDQQNIVRTYVELVREVRDARSDKGEDPLFWVEWWTQVPELHPEWFGTADAVVLHAGIGRLTIIDLKCGRLPVGVFEYGCEGDPMRPNPQLGSYAISVMRHLPAEVQHRFTEVELIIVQPREGGIKRAVFPLSAFDNLRTRLLEAAQNAESDNPRIEAGPACHFCKVKPVCPEQRRMVLEDAKLDFALEGGAADELKPEELHEVLKIADAAIEWGQSVKAYAERRLMAGDPLDGNWHLVPKKAKRIWKDEKAVVDVLMDAGLELEDVLTENVRSPAQIEAILKQKGLKLDLSDYIESVSTGLKIAKVVDEGRSADNTTGPDEWD